MMKQVNVNVTFGLVIYVLHYQLFFPLEIQCSGSCTTPGFVKAPNESIKETVVALPFKASVSITVLVPEKIISKYGLTQYSKTQKQIQQLHQIE